MKNLQRKAFFTSFAVVATLVACGGGGNTSTPSVAVARAYLGTQAPGDVWSLSLTDTTFTAKNSATTFAYSGTVSPLSTGFKKLTVTVSTDPGVIAGSVGYATELPNTAVLVYLNAAKPPIVAAGIGDCPTAAQTYNWVVIPTGAWNYLSENAYGSVAMSVSSSSYSFNVTNFKINSTANAGSSSNGWACSGGTFTKTATTETISTVPSGALIYDRGVGLGGLVGIPQPAAQISGSQLANKTFIGVQWAAGTNTETIQGVFNPSGASIAGTSIDPVTGTTSNGGAIPVVYTATPGLLTGTSPWSNPMAFSVSQVGGKYIIFGVTYSGSNKPYNFLVVEK